MCRLGERALQPGGGGSRCPGRFPSAEGTPELRGAPKPRGRLEPGDRPSMWTDTPCPGPPDGLRVACRTAVNAQSGVCTPAGGLVTGALVLLSLGYLTSLFYYIPKAALAAVIISAVAPLLDARLARTLWRVRRLDLLPLSVTFLLCLWEVQYGLLAGTLVSLLLLLRSAARPGMQVSEWPVLVVQPAGGLHFPAVEALREAVASRALEASPPRSAVLECSHVCSLDYTAVLGLRELLEDFRRRGLTLALAGLQEPVRRVLLAAGLNVRHFPSLEEAERYLLQESGPQPPSTSDDDIPGPLLPC